MIMSVSTATGLWAQIDVHSHAITTSYMDFIKAHGAEMDEGFPIPGWNVEEHLAFMDQAGIETAVLTMPAPQPWFGDGAESAAFCRKYNEECAALKARYPGRFLFCAALPLPDVKRAVEEAVYALDVLHADGVKLATNSYGQYLGDPELESLMEVLNALGALQQVIKERTDAGLRVDEGREADPLPKDYDALKQGTEVQTKLVGGQPFTYAFAPQTDFYLKAHLFGDIFARNNLTFAEREIVTVSAISALPGCEPQLVAHVSGARNMGVSDDELRALPAFLEEKVGFAEAERLRGALASVLGGAHTPVQTVDFSVWPQGEPNSAYAQYFTGNSYLAPMEGGIANVTFEPRCRNNWHIHHKQVQVLICVAGRGWYQEWGKPAVPMTPGTIIAIPAEVKHWHGAAKDSWFQHLTYHKDVQDGASNEWLEPVTDGQYDAL